MSVGAGGPLGAGVGTVAGAPVRIDPVASTQAVVPNSVMPPLTGRRERHAARGELRAEQAVDEGYVILRRHHLCGGAEAKPVQIAQMMEGSGAHAHRLQERIDGLHREWGDDPVSVIVAEELVEGPFRRVGLVRNSMLEDEQSCSNPGGRVALDHRASELVAQGVERLTHELPLLGGLGQQFLLVLAREALREGQEVVV